jgi:uncharacterized repeat protein (TIGR01451 family)
VDAGAQDLVAGPPDLRALRADDAAVPGLPGIPIVALRADDAAVPGLPGIPIVAPGPVAGPHGQRVLPADGAAASVSATCDRTGATFVIVADPQFYPEGVLDKYDEWIEANGNVVTAINDIESYSWPEGTRNYGQPIAEPRGVVLLGDLTYERTYWGGDDCCSPWGWNTCGTEDEPCVFTNFRQHYEFPGQTTGVQFPVYVGLGNHDYSKNYLDEKSFKGTCLPWDIYNDCLQDSLDYVDVRHKGTGPHVPVPVSRFDTNSRAYSWDWGNVHLVQLHGINKDDKGYPYEDFNVQVETWLRVDLALHKDSQIVLFSHHNYNLVHFNATAHFYGHTHCTMYHPFVSSGSRRFQIGTPYTDHETDPNCIQEQPPTFAIVHISDEYMDIASAAVGAGGVITWNDDLLPDPFTVSFNNPPEVDPAGDQTVDEGTSHLFSLGTFTDPDACDSSWEVRVDWDDGESNNFAVTETGALAWSHTFTDDGTYFVDVWVGDDEPPSASGLYDTSGGITKTVAVRVYNKPPTATFNAPPSVDEGSVFTLSLTNIFDPSSNDTAAVLEYAFDCGDGSGIGPYSAITQTACSAEDDGLLNVEARIRDKDGDGTDYTAIVTVNTITPVARDDSYSTAEDQTLQVSAPGLLVNDIAGDPLSVVTYTQPASGTLALDADGSFDYTPPVSFTGTTSFTYRANDGAADTNPAVVTITVYNVNDAPVLTAASSMKLADIDESTPWWANNGTLVSDIIASAGGDPITDPDPGAQEGLAVYQVTHSNGTWEFSIDGGANWSGIDIPSPIHVYQPPFFDFWLYFPLLLASDIGTRIRFVPDDNWYGTAYGLNVAAWDQTSGTNGINMTVIHNPLNYGISLGQALVFATVTWINDAPSITGPTHRSTNEDTATFFPPGACHLVDDPDAGSAAQPISVTLVASHGTLTLGSTSELSFTVGDGVNDAAMSFTGRKVMINGALCTLTFSPAPDYNGRAGLQITVNDQGYTGLGGPKSDFINTEIIVNPVNDAPVLDNSGHMALAPINQDETDNAGTLVSYLIAGAGGDRITDVDAYALEGIAVTGVDNSNGDWQYSVVSNTTWLSFGSPSAGAARLLAVDDYTRLRFVPTAGYTGTVNPGLTFRAWDQTNGSIGGTIDTTTNGGTTAFSLITETAAITVQVAADLIVTDQTEPAFVVPGQELITHTVWVSNAGPSDISGATLTVTLSTNLVNPTWSCVTGGGATCSGSGSGDIADTLDLPLNGVVSYTIKGSVATSATRLFSLAEVNNPEIELDSADNEALIDPVVMVDRRIYLPLVARDYGE